MLEEMVLEVPNTSYREEIVKVSGKRKTFRLSEKIPQKSYTLSWVFKGSRLWPVLLNPRL